MQHVARTPVFSGHHSNMTWEEAPEALMLCVSNYKHVQQNLLQHYRQRPMERSEQDKRGMIRTFVTSKRSPFKYCYY